MQLDLANQDSIRDHRLEGECIGRHKRRSGLRQGAPRALFPTQIWMGDNHPYAVDKSGERFLFAIAPDPRVTVVMDWRALVNSREAR
jgi:hypothetical protein